ncbi:MAG: hypothetical protein ACHQK9_15080 [Reyranellales bacterium]
MKRSVVAAVVVFVLAGLAVAAVPLVQRHAAAEIKAEIERDGTTKVEDVEVGLFDRSVTLTNVRSTRVVTISAERWTVSGLAWPLGDVLRGRVPTGGWQLGDPLQADRIDVTGLRVAGAGGQPWTIGSIAIEGVDLARYDGEVDPGPYRPVILGARIMRALAVRRFEERGFAYTVPGETNSITIASISFEDLAHGKLGAFLLSGFRMTGSNPGEEIRLDQVKAAGLDLERVFTSMSAATWRLGMPLGRVGLDSARASGFGGKTFASRGLALGSVTTESTHETGGVTRARTRIEGFMFAPPLRGLESMQARLMMTAMGLKELKLGFDCAGTEDRVSNEVTIERCALEGVDLGEVNLTGKLVQLDQAFWAAMDTADAAKLAASTAALGSAQLVLADKSLLERSLKALAAVTAQPVATARANLAQEIRHFQPTGVLITDDLTKLLDTVARFVEQGGTLTIHAKPEPPFGLDKVRVLRSPGPDLVDVLGLSATLSR